MSAAQSEARPPLARDELVAWLRREGLRRYHHAHPFHARMHAGLLSPEELARWVNNRYYYQTRIPIKDALILAKASDPAFRRMWGRRLRDQDGEREGEGGLAQWERLAEAVGVPVGPLRRFEGVLPGVRFACDAYVTLVREASLLEAVAASLTECFAPDLMAARADAWERHYPWVNRGALEYFRQRTTGAARDAEEALAFVTASALTYADQARCVEALVRKTEILWHLLDCVDRAGAGAERAA